MRIGDRYIELKLYLAAIIAILSIPIGTSTVPGIMWEPGSFQSFFLKIALWLVLVAENLLGNPVASLAILAGVLLVFYLIFLALGSVLNRVFPGWWR